MLIPQKVSHSLLYLRYQNNQQQINFLVLPQFSTAILVFLVLVKWNKRNERKNSVCQWLQETSPSLINISWLPQYHYFFITFEKNLFLLKQANFASTLFWSTGRSLNMTLKLQPINSRIQPAGSSLIWINPRELRNRFVLVRGELTDTTWGTY